MLQMGSQGPQGRKIQRYHGCPLSLSVSPCPGPMRLHLVPQGHHAEILTSFTPLSP